MNTWILSAQDVEIDTDFNSTDWGYGNDMDTVGDWSYTGCSGSIVSGRLRITLSGGVDSFELSSDWTTVTDVNDHPIIHYYIYDIPTATTYNPPHEVWVKRVDNSTWYKAGETTTNTDPATQTRSPGSALSRASFIAAAMLFSF